MADGAVLRAEGDGQNHDRGVGAVLPEGQCVGGAKDRDHRQDRPLGAEGDRQPAARVPGRAGREPTAGQGADDKAGDGDERAHEGKAGVGMWDHPDLGSAPGVTSRAST
jgi:hypothetical protein